MPKINTSFFNVCPNSDLKQINPSQIKSISFYRFDSVKRSLGGYETYLILGRPKSIYDREILREIISENSEKIIQTSMMEQGSGFRVQGKELVAKQTQSK